MSTSATDAPLWALVDDVRLLVEPASLGKEVVHYSIPAVDATGTGQVERSESIQSTKLLLRGNEILISKLNPRKSRVLQVAPSTLPVVSSTEFVGLQPKWNIEASYLKYFLQSEITRQKLDANVQSVTRSHQRVAPEDIKRLRIKLPPLEEQRRIANFLDFESSKIDSLLTARDSQLRCLKQRWRSSLADVVNNLALKHGLLPLRRISRSVEQGWSPQCDDFRAGPAEWAVLKTSAVSTGTFQPLEHKRLPDNLKPDLRYAIDDGDILMTRGSGSPDHVGVATVAHPNGHRLLLSDLLYRVKLDRDWSSEFVTFMLSSMPTRGRMSLLFRGQSGQTIKLRVEDVKSIDIPSPPVMRQASIAQGLRVKQETIHRAQECIRQSGTRLAEYRQALITAAVTGQFDVSTASGRNVSD